MVPTLERRRDLGSRLCASAAPTLGDERTSLLWCQTTPDPEALTGSDRELETRLTDFACSANGLGIIGLLFGRREEELDLDPSARGVVLPFLVGSQVVLRSLGKSSEPIAESNGLTS